MRISAILILLAAGVVSYSSPGDEPPAGDLCVSDLPDQVDLRPQLKRWKLPARLQGSRGTCSVFAVTAAMEYALARRQDRGQTLSVEYLNWASNRAVGVMQDGGFFSDLWKGYLAYGICTEQAMPYRKTFDPNLVPEASVLAQAEQLSKENPLQLHWIKKWNPTTGLAEKELAAIKRVLSRNLPVCGGFRWPKQVNWKDGVLNIPPPEGVFDGHSVLLVGYREDPELPGGGVFIMRNSSHSGSENCMPFAYAAAYMNDAVWIDNKKESRETPAPIDIDSSAG